TGYLFTEDRSRDGPRAFFADYTGDLQADADTRLDEIYETGCVVEIGCWAHARRGFFESRTSDPVRAHQALGFIKKLYIVEELAHGLDAEARKALRLERSKPLLDDIEAWLLSQKSLVLPKSPIGKAIQYALNQWTALCRYAEDGRRAIDNNVAER